MQLDNPEESIHQTGIRRLWWRHSVDGWGRCDTTMEPNISLIGRLKNIIFYDIQRCGNASITDADSHPHVEVSEKMKLKLIFAMWNLYSWHEDNFVQFINNSVRMRRKPPDINIFKKMKSLEGKGWGRRRMAKSGSAGRGRRGAAAAAAAAASGRKEVRMDEAHGWTLVDPGVLLQVIPATETFGTDGTAERTQSGVDAFMPRKLLIPRKSLPAGFIFAFERSLTFNEFN